MDDKKQKTHQRMLEAASQGFRKLGFAGAGVDGLARRAGVTSGAFYAHFGSKAKAFAEALKLGLGQFNEGLQSCQKEDPDNFLDSFAEFYLSDRRICSLEEGCSFQVLAAEAGRGKAAEQQIFAAELERSLATLVEGGQSRQEALNYLATLVGAVTLSRAVGGEELGQELAQAAQKALKKAR